MCRGCGKACVEFGFRISDVDLQFAVGDWREL